MAFSWSTSSIPMTTSSLGAVVNYYIYLGLGEIGPNSRSLCCCPLMHTIGDTFKSCSCQRRRDHVNGTTPRQTVASVTTVADFSTTAVANTVHTASSSRIIEYLNQNHSKINCRSFEQLEHKQSTYFNE